MPTAEADATGAGSAVVETAVADEPEAVVEPETVAEPETVEPEAEAAPVDTVEADAAEPETEPADAEPDEPAEPSTTTAGAGSDHRQRVSRPVAVAITGGIGAGKSEALRAFARHGAATVSSDEIVHHLLLRDEVKRVIVERLGNGVLAPDGEIDRGALGTVVFNDRAALTLARGAAAPARLGRVPEVARRPRERCPNAPAVCVTEVPLLYETGGDERFDKVVVITAPKQLRRMRSDVATDDREARLIPDREKLERADYSFKNLGSLEELDAFVDSVMRDLAAVRRLAWVTALAARRRGRVPVRERDLAAVVRAAALPAPLLRVRPGARPRAQARPGADGGGDLPGVEVRPRTRSRRRARSA